MLLSHLSSRLRLIIVAAFAVLQFPAALKAYTKSTSGYITNGSLSDVAAAIANASDGDVISVPQGSYTWGDSGSYLALNKAVTLQGAGIDKTIINLSPTGSTVTNGVMRIQSAGAIIRDFTVLPPASGNKATPFSTSGSGYLGWRITNIKYDCTGSSLYSYFIYVGGNYGLIDHCTVIGGGGTNELIFARGTTDSWQTPSSMGSQNALFVEDCTFGGQGYVCDINDNGRAVFRYNTISGQMKIDGHGYASNSKRGVRQMEVYRNHWTADAGFWAAIELRGGTGMVFDNICDNVTGVTVKAPSLSLKEYGCLSTWSNFGNLYQTPLNYPVKDQVGVGMDPLAPGSEPMYLWNNIRGGANWGVSAPAIPDAAIAYYQALTANLTATFAMEDIIKPDRDYFAHTADVSFDGSTGVGRGTKTQMMAIKPTRKGVGFWVTDEGTWNRSGSTQGQLYTWSGSSWTLKYIPYTYPHLLQDTPALPTALAAPTITVKAN